MSLTESIDDIVNFIPNQSSDLAFRVVKEPGETLANLLGPARYAAGLSAEAAAIGCTAGALSHNSYIGWSAAAATVVASWIVKGIKIYNNQ